MPTKYLGQAPGSGPGLLGTGVIYWTGDYLRNVIDAGGHSRKETKSHWIHSARLGKIPGVCLVTEIPSQANKPMGGQLREENKPPALPSLPKVKAPRVAPSPQDT